MSIKVSYILPCYNVGRYVSDCLDSLYGQGMQEDEFEVICVNDCSTDDTRDIILRYAWAHTNIKLMDHETNMTAGGARNTGLSVAAGEYIWFVDPDDMVQVGMARPLYDRASSDGLDILFFNHKEVDESLAFIQDHGTFCESETMTGQDYVARYFPHRLKEICIIWRALFKREFLTSHQLHFPIMRKSQDVAFLWKALPYASRVGSCSAFGYVYRTNPYSVANMKHDAKVIFSERILFGSEIVAILDNKETELKAPFISDLQDTLSWCANSNLNELKQMSGEEIGRYYDEMRSHAHQVSVMRRHMNRKHRMLFRMAGGKRCWMYKVSLACKYL